MAVSSNAVVLYTNLNFDFVRDIAPVASVMRAPYVLAVNPTVPAYTVPEFIAYARPTQASSTWPRPASAPGPM
jgi:tripartite-type tricarboxylate transporter receptor subunit TctC